MKANTIFAYETFQELTCLPVGRFTIFFSLAICWASLTWAQFSSSFSSFLLCAGQKVRESNGNFYYNLLMLEGVAFNDNVFTLKSKGELKLIKAIQKAVISWRFHFIFTC